MTSAYTSCATPSGAFTFVNERRADHLRAPERSSDWLRSKAIVGNACARAVACVRALGDGCVTPNLAINARSEDRALKIKNRFVRWFRSVPDGPLSRLP